MVTWCPYFKTGIMTVTYTEQQYKCILEQNDYLRPGSYLSLLESQATTKQACLLLLYI